MGHVATSAGRDVHTCFVDFLSHHHHGFEHTPPLLRYAWSLVIHSLIDSSNTWIRKQKMLERFGRLQAKWRKTLVVLNWTMVAIATVVSLLPIFFNCDQQRRGYPTGHFANLLHNSSYHAPLDSATVLSIITDDGIFQGSDINFSMIMGPFLGMCLPALLDLMVDVYAAVTHPTTGMNANNSSKIVRLSLLERFVFIIGVMDNAFYFLIPTDWNVMVLYTVRRVVNNLSIILLAAPIIIFLERSTHVFSPFFTTLVIFLMTVGGTLRCFTFNFVKGTMIQHQLIVYSAYLILAYVCLVLSACLWSFLQYLFHQRTTRAESAATSGLKNKQLDPFQDFSVNHVPACHMVSLCIGYCVSLAWFLAPINISPSTNSLLYTLLLCSLALVFVIEMRVRQNEIVHGMHLLNSKRAFVRFISHEVRF